MFGHPVVAVACEGEAKPGRGRGCRSGIFSGCRDGCCFRGIFPVCRGRVGSTPGVGCRCRCVCGLCGDLPALRFDAEDAMEDMASFTAEQHYVARLQGVTSGQRGIFTGALGRSFSGFASRLRPVLLLGGCFRAGSPGVCCDRGQDCDVAFAAQQGPHAVAFHAYLDFVSFGEHRFDLLEKQTVRKLHYGRELADSSPKIVRQASSAAAASGRHSRW